MPTRPSVEHRTTRIERRATVAGAIGALALAAGGCGGDSSDRPASSAPAKPTVTGPAAGQASRRPVAPGGTVEGRTTAYSGDGSKRLPLELKRSAVLRWTTDGSRFRLTDPNGRLKVAGGARGRSFAAAGNYPGARVTTEGKWRLTVQLLPAPKVQR